jgi:hypothetical protein
MSGKDHDKPLAEEPGNEPESAEEADRRIAGDPDEIPHFVGSGPPDDEMPSGRPMFTGTPVADESKWRRAMRQRRRNDR